MSGYVLTFITWKCHCSVSVNRSFILSLLLLVMLNSGVVCYLFLVSFSILDLYGLGYIVLFSQGCGFDLIGLFVLVLFAAKIPLFPQFMSDYLKFMLMHPLIVLLF